jgi:hypothetical protein
MNYFDSRLTESCCGMGKVVDVKDWSYLTSSWQQLRIKTSRGRHFL